jgi:hypothetical protein
VTVVMLVAVVVLAVAVTLLAAGLVEVYAQLVQVRAVLRLQDQPTPAQLPTVGRKVVELLPEPPAQLRPDATRAEDFVLVLSNTCAVCHTIGTELAQTRPDWADGIAVLVACDTEEAGKRFVADLGLNGPRLLVDHRAQYAERLGVDSSPTVVRIRDGRVDAGANLTSLRQLRVFVTDQPA